MSSKVKRVKVVYVGPIPTERSGIGRDVPAHVVLEYRDNMGRINKQHLDLPVEMVQRVSVMPDETDE